MEARLLRLGVQSPGKDLNAALKQLQYYVRSLESPPLLIVSDMERIELHTNTGR